MNIYFNGDSNTIGTELINPEVEAFHTILSSLLNAASFRNDALAGASNSRIMRTTEQYLFDCKNKQEFPDMIIIGWSSMEREDWYYKSAYRSLNSFGLNMDTAKEHDIDRYNYWKQHYWQDKSKANSNRRAMSIHFNNSIFNLHSELTELKIPHVFFNALTSFSYDFNDDTDHPYEFDWGTSFIEPYNQDACMVEWAQSKGHIPTEWLHFDKEAHKEFADLLFGYIKDNNIIISR